MLPRRKKVSKLENLDTIVELEGLHGRLTYFYIQPL